MKISVIVPIYNAEKYLSACIESILNQTFTDFELILVNDGSTDGSFAICEQYRQKDSRIVIINKPNGGSSSAKNEGMKIAKGEFIEFVDADDLLDTEYMESLAEGFRNPQVDLCVGNVCMVKEKNGEIISENKMILHSGLFSLSDFLQFYPEYMPRAVIGSPCNKLYRLEIIKQHHLQFDTSLKNNEDTRFNYAYIAKCRNVFVAEKPYYRYFDRGGVSASKGYIKDLFAVHIGTYHCAVIFLKETNTYTEHIHFQNAHLINLVIGTISNIVKHDNSSSKVEKIRRIKTMLCADEVVSALPDARVTGFIKKAIVFLMRHKQAALLHALFTLK